MGFIMVRRRNRIKSQIFFFFWLFCLVFWRRCRHRTISLLIIKKIRCSSEINNRKIILPLKDSCPTTNNLLKLHHTSNTTEQNDISDILGIYPCCEHLRTGQNSRNRFPIILKKLKIFSSDFSFITRHSHAVISITHGFMFIDRISHQCCMLLIHTENDRFFMRFDMF